MCFEDAFNPARIATYFDDGGGMGDRAFETSDAPLLSHCSALVEWGSAAAL